MGGIRPMAASPLMASVSLPLGVYGHGHRRERTHDHRRAGDYRPDQPLRRLGRFRLDWASHPAVHMEHDLRRSAITIAGDEGKVRLEVRAHKELDVIRIDVARWWPSHFDTTFIFPCGLAQEDSPFQGDRRCISIHPSMQGLGTGVIPVLEMLLQDYPDLLIILPCWDPKVAVRFAL